MPVRLTIPDPVVVLELIKKLILFERVIAPPAPGSISSKATPFVPPVKLIVFPVACVPRLLLLVILMPPLAPDPMVTPPVKVLFPERVSMPAPVLLIATTFVPVPLPITPDDKMLPLPAKVKVVMDPDPKLFKPLAKVNKDVELLVKETDPAFKLT